MPKPFDATLKQLIRHHSAEPGNEFAVGRLTVTPLW